MLVNILSVVKVRDLFKSLVNSDSNDSYIDHVSELECEQEKELIHISIFDGNVGLVDVSDKLYTAKKCLSSFSLDIPTHEKITMLEWLSTYIAKLDDTDYSLLSSWCNDAYKSLCKHLKGGIGIGSNAVEIANIFRWGSSLIKKDIHLSRSLIEQYYPFHEVVSNPAAFHCNVVYAHSQMLSYYYFDLSFSKFERTYYARTSIGLLNHLLTFDTALNNRANYLLSMVYKVLGDIDKSLYHFIKALTSKHALPFQRNLIIRFIFDSLPEEKLPSRLEKLLTDNNRALSCEFWLDVSNGIISSEIRNRISSYVSVLSNMGIKEGNSPMLSKSEIDELNSYIESVCSIDYCHDESEISRLLSVVTSKDTPAISKSLIFKRLAYSSFYASKCNAMYYASMSLFNRYDADLAIFIQRMLIDADYGCVCDAIISSNKVSRDLAMIKVAESLEKNTWVNGDPLSETAMLYYIVSNSLSSVATDLAKVRGAFLYIKGECTANQTLGIQNFKKGDGYLDSISIDNAQTIKNGIREHGFYRHQSKLIQSSDDGEYVFYENKESDRLIIVFSCRYTYNVFQAGPRFLDGLETNALFINNPAGNWYSDKEDERVSRIIEKYALSKFSHNKIFCHNASMGGYAAIKFSIKHNLICIAANPQFNLNFWSFARPGDSKRILTCESIVNLDKMPLNKIDGLKACIIIGRHPHDVLPFQSWLDHAIKAKSYTYVIIKHDIPEHEALMYRAYGDTFMKAAYKEFDVLQDISLLISNLRPCDFGGVLDVQNLINASNSGRWVLHKKDGQYFIS